MTKQIRYEEYDDQERMYYLIYEVPDDVPDDITESQADYVASAVWAEWPGRETG